VEDFYVTYCVLIKVNYCAKHALKAQMLKICDGLLGVSLWTLLTQVASAQSLCPSQLGSTIDAMIQQPALRTANWGILVQEANGTTPYSHNADRLLMPASNAKLLTTAAALATLTPQFQQQTPFFATGQPPNLETLRVEGHGDPSLNEKQLEQIAVQLQSKGVQSIGTLVADDSFFTGSLTEPSWTWEDLQGGDGLPINSLMLNGNVFLMRLTPQQLGQPVRSQWLSSGIPKGVVVINRSVTVSASAPESLETYWQGNQLVVKAQLRAGSTPETIDIPVTNPGMNFLERLRSILGDHQIQVQQVSLTTTPITQPQALLPIATIAFPSLGTLLSETNQNSNNFYAESLLRQLGKRNPVDSPTVFTAQQGLTVLSQALARLGVNSTGYRLIDGSGLSRKNLASPRAIVQTLRGIDQPQYRNIFRASLPVAGQRGTLRRRLIGTAAEGRLWAKTGTLKGVTALSGYLERLGQPTLTFSILVNQSPQPTAVLQQAVDRVVLAIAQLKLCQPSQNNP
jgi:serine-type D-Ala-D-Ala carboxypeptidase/endopeptidase (penicillin-binding protein 4)